VIEHNGGYLIPFIGGEVFGNVLLILLRKVTPAIMQRNRDNCTLHAQEDWTNDNLLWDMIGFLEETYSFLVMGMSTAPGGSSSEKVFANGSAMLSDLPRQVYSQLILFDLLTIRVPRRCCQIHSIFPQVRSKL
jgi:hypothetical protein